MIIPKLKKIKSDKKYHNIVLEDEYGWVDQPDILEVLKDANKLNPDVKEYIEANNKITNNYFNDVKESQKSLFSEIKSKIKLDDTSLKFKDKKYYYWSKTEAKGNYEKRVRQLIDGSKPEEIYFDGDQEKKNYGSEYFGIGAVSTSHCDKYMAYSLDLKGSEYYTISLRNLNTGENEKDIDINKINESIKKIGRDFDLSTEDMNKCLADEQIENKILNERIEAQKNYEISSTPTIYINKKK